MACLCLSSVACGNELRPVLDGAKWSLSAINDNDYWAVGGGDKDYTNGLRVTFRADQPRLYIKSNEGVTPIYIEQLRAQSTSNSVEQLDGQPNDCCPLEQFSSLYEVPNELELFRRAFGFHFASNLYTASDIDLSIEEFDPDERPYAGWLYTGIFSEKTNSKDATDRIELNLGCIGPCAEGERIQKDWHKLIGASEPQGWDSEIDSQAAVHLMLRAQRPLFRSDIGGSPEGTIPRNWDLAAIYETELGNVFTNASIGFQFRQGIPLFGAQKLKSYFAGTGVPVQLPSRAAPEILTCQCASRPVRQLFFYSRGRAKAVARNSTIQGGFNDDSRFTQDIRHFVTEFEAGVVFQHNRFHLSYSMTMRSTEVDEQSFDIAEHYWGTVRISFPLNR